MKRCLPTTKKITQNRFGRFYRAMMPVKAYALLLGVLFWCNSGAQITVTQNASAAALSQMLVGSGVTISNVTMNCNTLASGTFTNVSSNIGLNQGIIMATGKVSNIPQAAGSFASTSLTGTGDPQLSTLTGGTIYDPCVLQFDIVPQGDTLQFRYVFASEEYPEFVCSQFNDVFGFFISGPNPAGGAFASKNIATIPNSTTPVCINSVNGGISGTYNGTTWNSNQCISLSNTTDYVNNLVPVNANIVYDGMTKVLTAVSAVVPCQTYHLKLAIADVGDRFYDSGVFLEAYSITSTPYNIAITSKINDSAYAAVYEGCVTGTFTVSISQAQGVPVTVNLNVSGTATNGVDYNSIPSSVIIPAGQTSVTIPLNAIQDGIVEPAETVTLAVLNQCSGVPSTSATLTIMDDPARSLIVADSVLCLGHSTQLTATGGKTYLWSPAAGLSSTTIANPVATPTVTTTYTVDIKWGSCDTQLVQTIHVNPPVALQVSPSDTVCPGASIQLSVSAPAAITPYTYVWSTGSTSSNITASASGNYEVTGTDGFGCTASAVKSLAVLSPVLSGIAGNVACFGGSTGSIHLTANGGITPYTYLWGNGSTAANLTNLAAGHYQVTATDYKGCTASTSVSVSQPAGALNSVATVVNNVSCFGGNNGVINLAVTGGNLPYLYTWAGGVITQNRTNLIAGIYHVTVTDSTGCTATASAVITEPTSVLNLAAAVTNVNCVGNNTGAINLTTNGGFGPYTYVWGDAQITQNRSGLGAGNYTVTATDANGCSLSASAVITQPSATLSATTQATAVSCFSDNNGSVNLTVTGGTQPYYYSWNSGATIPDISHLVSGTYSVTVSDAKGCSVTTSAIVSQPSAALALQINAANVSCFGGANGTLTTLVTGGTAGYTYIWNDGITNPDRVSVGPGNYHLTVTDAKGCTASASTNLSQPAAALGITPITGAVSCFGGNNGFVHVNVAGGAIPYNFIWNDGSILQNRNALVAGSYTVTVTDAQGCSAVATPHVIQPSAALNAVPSIVAVACFNGNTGSVNLSTTGGTAPYQYSWSNGATTQNIAQLPAGNYTATVTDAANCTLIATVDEPQPTWPVIASPNITNVSCFNSNTGAITLTVTGGTAGYSYSWSDAVNTQNRSNLSAGNYTVTVTDSKGCTAQALAAVIQPAANLLLAVNANNVNCYGGNHGGINLNVTGGTSPYTYNWAGGIITQNRTGLVAGTYPVTVADANGCSATSVGTITQPSAALSLNPTIVAVACYGAVSGAVNLAVSGGTPSYSYAWSNGASSQNINSISAGNYTVTVTDSKGCFASAAANVSQPVSLLSVTGSTTNVGCYGDGSGAVNLTVSGGTSPYTYNWNDGVTSQNRSGLLAGNYNVTVTDLQACTATLAANITQPVAALNLTSNTTQVACFGASTGGIDLNVSAGVNPYSYQWSNGSSTQNITSVAAGSYTVTVQDANACSATLSAVVSQPNAALAVSPASVQAVFCFGAQTGAVNMTVSGGTNPYTYAWSNGNSSQNINSVSAGNYSVTITDNKGCVASAAANVSQPVSLLSVTGSTTNVGCYGAGSGAVNLNVSGGTSPYTYNWNDGVTSQNRSGLLAGNYNVTVTDLHACTATLAANITQPVAALNLTSNTTQVACFGSSTGGINLNVSGGVNPYSYQWSNGSSTQNITSVAAGSYTVTVQDANACSATLSAVVSQPNAALAVSPASVQAVLCFGAQTGAVNMTVSGGTNPYTYAWSNGETLSALANVGAGNYTIRVTDLNGCSASAQANVQQPAGPLAVTTTISAVLCYGNNTGSIAANVAGGTSPYIFNWSDGITTQNRTNLIAGNYPVTVVDNNGCSALATAVVTQPAASVNVSLATTAVNCYGGSTGQISTQVSGGSAPYTYYWNTGSGLTNPVNLVAGNYKVTVADNNLCSATATADITQPSAALGVASQLTSNLCYGGNNGGINLMASGGTAPYNYNWGNGISGNTRSNLSAGVYIATITDVNGCSVVHKDTIRQSGSAVSATVNVSNVPCYGDSNGLISVVVNGGVAPYNYIWSDGTNSLNRSNLLAGNYVLTITDAANCSATVATGVIQPALPLSALSTITNVSCFGGNNGSINFTASGGTSPYSYKWDNGITTQNRAQLVAGNYTMSVTDANGCLLVKPNTVSQPAALSVVLHATSVSCYGGNNGAVTTTASGGVYPYVYHWTNGTSNANLNQAVAGNYSLTLTDANSCVASATAQVVQPQYSITAGAAVNNVSCYHGNNGSIYLHVSGGSAPYTFSWNGGDTAQNRFNLVAGNYNVVVADHNGCSASVTSTVEQPGALTAVAHAIPVSCFGGSTGSVDLSVSGGTSPYTFVWSSGQTSQNIIGVLTGSYSVDVSDANACSAGASANVSQPSANLHAVASVTNVKCFGEANGTISLTVTGGTPAYHFIWGNGNTSQNIQNLTAGNYNVTVTDHNGCSATGHEIINQPTALSITGVVSNVNCLGGNNGAINIHVAGGVTPYSYNWGNGILTQNRNGLTAGNYVVSVTDDNLCSVTSAASVTQPISALAISSSIGNVNCYQGNNGSVRLNVSGGSSPYSYNWGGGVTNPNRTNLAAGSYPVTITDAQGCSLTATENVSQPSAAVHPVISVQAEVSCYQGNNGVILLSATGGVAPYSYHWNDGVSSENRGNVVAGNYYVTITDHNGCLATDSAHVTQPLAGLSVNAASSDITCYGAGNGSINLTVNGGTPAYNFNWGNGLVTQNRSHLAAGNYHVTVTDQHGCSVTLQTVLSQPATGINVSQQITEATCFKGNNGTALLNATGGTAPYSFNWSGGVSSQGRGQLTAGNYPVTVTDANGCSVMNNVTITSPDSIHITSVVTSPSCFGSANGQIKAIATGGTPAYYYAWNTGGNNLQLNSLSAGNYSLTVTDINGCTAALSNITMDQPAAVNVAVQVLNGSCAGGDNGSVTAAANGGTLPYHFIWSNGKSTSTIGQLSVGNYAVTVTDANLCTQNANAVVSAFPGVSARGFTNGLPCQNARGQITLNDINGTSPFSFKWSNGDTTQDIYNVHPGNYTVTMIDAHGCSFDTTFTIDNLNSFNVQATGQATIILGANSEIHATGTGSNQTAFNWTPSVTLSCATCSNSLAQPVETTTYTVIGTDTNGCTASDTVSIIVIEDHTIFVPNAFTPNGDGNNDVFQIYGNLAGIHNFEVKIFNRWGEKVFDSEKPDFKWDGTYKGVLQNPNVFVYEMKIVFDDGHSDELKKGSITLVR